MKIFNPTMRGLAAVEGVDTERGAVATIMKEGFNSDTVVITKIQLDQSVNIQFMPTLADLIYVYSFGDRMGDVRVSGLCFDRTCTSQGHNRGMDSLISYYQQYRAVKKDTTVDVYFGDWGLRGFLVSMAVGTSDPETRMAAFSLNIAALPRPTKGGSSGGGSSSGGSPAPRNMAESIAAMQAAGIILPNS